MGGLARAIIGTCLFASALNVPANAHAQCIADLDGDGMIGASDTDLFVSCRDSPDMLRCSTIDLDINADGIVDWCDLNAIRCRTLRSDPGPSCCNVPCTPECTADFNGDGFVSVADLGPVAACLNDSSPPECAAADISGDGVVDCYDFGAYRCLYDPETSSADCCESPPCDCNCIPYVTVDVVLDATDIEATVACIGQPLDDSCRRADIDCDGEVTRCDADVVEAQVVAGAYDALLCEAMPCGACRVGDDCQYRSSTRCEAQGGAFMEGEACTDTPPPPPPPDEPLPQFRGGGGASCGASSSTGAPTALALLGMAGLLLAFRRRRR